MANNQRRRVGGVAKMDNIIAGICSISSVALLNEAVSPNPVLGWLQVILAFISIVASIASFVSSWYIKAKKDGKITPEEIKDLADGVKDITDKK